MCSPLITGVAKGIKPLGLLLDPLNLTGVMGKKPESAPPPPDPAVERATAEAEAAQRANAQLAENNRRRREQGSLMSKGAPAAPQFSLGDSTTDPGSNTLSATGATTRNTVAQRSSLMARGATIATGGAPVGPTMTYGGGGGRRTVSTMAAL